MILNILKKNINSGKELNDAKLAAKSSQAQNIKEDTTSFYSYLVKNKKIISPKKLEKIRASLNVFNDSKMDRMKSFLSENSENIVNNDQNSTLQVENNLQLNNFNQKFSKEFPNIFKNIENQENSRNYSYSISGEPQENERINLEDIKNIIGGFSDFNKIQKNTFSIKDIKNLFNENSQDALSNSVTEEHQLSSWMNNDDVKKLIDNIFGKDNKISLDLESKFKVELNKIFGVDFLEDLSIKKLDLNKEQLSNNISDFNSFTDDLSKNIKEMILLDKTPNKITESVPLKNKLDDLDRNNLNENNLGNLLINGKFNDTSQVKEFKDLIFEDIEYSKPETRVFGKTEPISKFNEGSFIKLEDHAKSQNDFSEKSPSIIETDDFTNFINLFNNEIITDNENLSKITNNQKNDDRISRFELSDINNRIKLFFNDINRSGDYSVNIKLNPKELGNINIQMQLFNDSARINFKADSNESIVAIQSQMEELISSLKDRGIKVETCEVNLNSLRNDENLEQQSNQNRKKHKENIEKQLFINSFAQNLNSANL